MPHIKVIKVQNISTGIILKRLIDERFTTHKKFVEAFNKWKDNSSYSGRPHIMEKDLSRWIRGVVKKPHDIKLKMFSDFFGVDIDYLKCEKIRIPRINSETKFKLAESIQEESLLKSLKKEESLSALEKYCKHLGIKITSEPIKTVPVISIEEVIQDGKLYTIEITDDSPSDVELTVLLQDGSSTTITDNQLDELSANIERYVEFEFSKLFKAKK